MAIEYALIVPGGTTPEEMWPRLHRTPVEPTVRKGVWRADETDQVGYVITMHRGRDGYFEFDDDVRKPKEYLHVGFRQDWDQSPQRLAHNLLELVQNVLDSGDEDLWLSINGEELILERTGGEVRRLRAGFWNNVEE